MNKLPILMYHNITDNSNNIDDLTVLNTSLEDHFSYLSKYNYKTFHFNELKKLDKLPKKSIVITFDDVTQNQLEFAVPLLEKYNLKATFFIPFAYINKTDEWNNGTQKIMSIEQLKQLNINVVELGYHSFYHKKYSSLSKEEINLDFIKCNQIIKQHNLNICNTLAYPYGNYPKDKVLKNEFQNTLKENNIYYGLRIGNRLNRFPFKNNFEIKRIDIKGFDSFLKFKIKIRIGKLKLF